MSQLSATAVSLTEAARALRQPEPPERHWIRVALLVAAVAGGATLAWQRTTNDSST